jgi:hypothetical protein
MTIPEKIVYLDDEIAGDALMKFRLTYEGEVPSSQSKAANAKMDMRKSFQLQLRQLWAQTCFLNDAIVYPSEHPDEANSIRKIRFFDSKTESEAEPLTLAMAIANNHVENGYKFVPIVRETANLACSLNILLLRNDGLRSAVTAGDLDNRMKTIIDALKRPKNKNELGSYLEPTEDEDPFFVLLEDDVLVTRLTAEADDLLSPVPNGNYKNSRWAKVVIDVEIYPSRVTEFNFNYL